MEHLEIRSTSAHSAVCSDFVVREGPASRLVFRAEIVDNPHDQAASIRGRFVYQRKGKNESWEGYPLDSLAHLKKGEGYQLEIRAGELLPLLRKLSDLYRLHRRQGVPQGRQQFVRLEQSLAQFLELSEPDLASFLSANTADAVRTLERVLRWLSRSTSLADFFAADASQVSLLSAVLGIASLRAIRQIWESNRDNSDEEFWQKTLAGHAFVFSQLFAYPVLVIQNKAYVGGKQLDNKHGNVVDFLAKAERTSNALLIEIKTPTSPILGSKYRDGVFPPSRELGGALSQVLQYRESLTEEVRSLASSSQLLAVEPRCLVLIGDAERQLKTEGEVRSFERFRERLAGVTVVTFDELFRRVTSLEEILAPDAI